MFAVSRHQRAPNAPKYEQSNKSTNPLTYIPGRLVRLIPEDADPHSERNAIKSFFNHRLSFTAGPARLEWLDIVEGRHALWTHITPAKKELIRSFLNYVNLEIVKRARPSSTFDFQSASVGNLFLTGARLFTGSFESAIYLLASIGAVPDTVQVVPAINSNFSHHISAGLEDGSVITGQTAISHPSAPTALPDGRGQGQGRQGRGGGEGRRGSMDAEEQDRIEDANLPGSLATLREKYITFSKEREEELPARIRRIWYINPYGQEIRPTANPKAVEVILRAECVVYSIGSLYTSIVPSIILRGVSHAMASTSIRYKVLILNGSLDRETGPSYAPLTALDFVAAIARAGAESMGNNEELDTCKYREFVTHLIHLEGEGTPVVDKPRFAQLGIECIRLYGRKAESGKGMKYDGKALSQALEVILGRRDPKTDRSRRNTLEH